MKMRKLILLLMMLVTIVDMSQAQSNTPPIGTWESSESLLYSSIDMKVSYRRVRVVITADQFRVTEWVRGTRDLPGVGLNCQMHLRNEWACKYVWEGGNTMRVKRIVQNPKVKMEKFSLGGDPTLLKTLRAQGVTDETYRPTMEQSMNSSSVTFDVTAILVKNRKTDEFVFSYEGVRNITLKRVADTKKTEAPKTQTETVTNDKKEDQATDKPVESPAAETSAQPADTSKADSVVNAETSQPVAEAKPVAVKEDKPAEKPVEVKQEVQEEKAWYIEAWDSFMSWF